MVAARVCAHGVPKGKTKEEETGGGRPCLMMMHGATNARREGKTHTHHHENQTQTPGPFKEGDVTSLYGWGWRLWYHTSKTRARGDASKTARCFLWACSA